MVRIKKPELKSELLEIIKKVGRREDDYIVFDMEAILRLWEKSHKGPFKQHGYGKMSAFLRQEIGATESDGKYRLENERVGACCVEKKAATTKSSESVGVSAQSTGVADKSAISRVPAFICDSGETGPNDKMQPRSDAKNEDEDPPVSRNTENEVLKPVVSDEKCTNATILDDKRAGSHSVNESKECSLSTDYASTVTTNKQIVPRGYSEEERNHAKFVKVLYKCGLHALRELFLKIHPCWRDGKGDTENFVRGNLELTAKEKSMFNTGNVGKWDITLICKVLLYSTASCRELDENAGFRDCRDAIVRMRDIKNDFVSHNIENEISEQKYQALIEELKGSVLRLGFDGSEFDDCVKGAELHLSNNQILEFSDELKRFRHEQSRLFKESLQNQEVIMSRMSRIEEDISTIMLQMIQQNSLSQSDTKQNLKLLPDYHEWVNVKRKLRNLDIENNQYILIVDRFEELSTENMKIIADVPWKLVIDLDPNSDIDGFLTNFDHEKSRGGSIVYFTPSKVKENVANVDNMIDPRRMQWLFANGRNRKRRDENDKQNDNDDRQKDTLHEWKMAFQGPANKIIRICCQKLDRMKQTFVIVFGIRVGISMEISRELVEEINREFDLAGYSINFLSFTPELDLGNCLNATFTNLSPQLFLAGLTSLLGIPEEKYKLPSSQKDLPVYLTQMQFNFLRECLELLYIGCQEIPEDLADDEKEAFKNEHLKKFLCGNEISFPSLHYRYDASRCITKKVHDRISEMLHHSNKPQIVQITHAPGSGGTTIARRALWDLHETHPCAIVKLEIAPETFGSNSEGEKYLNSLCKCISSLEDLCFRPPAILIDGNSRQVRILSDCLVMKLKARAVIVRCAHYEKQTGMEEDNMQSNQADERMWKSEYFESEDKCVPGRRNDTYFKKEDEFRVNPRLKDDDNDYCEFKMKYDYYCSLFSRNDNASISRKRERVFHFPMMAMLDEFEKLGEIITESLNILKNEEPVEYEIAVVIAFLQLYSKFPTPASLIKKFVKSNSKTYKDVTKHFSETLMNLMIPGKAPSKEKFIGALMGKDYSDDNDDEGDDEYNSDGSSSSMGGSVLHSYSFQHLEVAKLVLDHSGRSLDQITQEFIQSKILENYRKDDEIRLVIDYVFLYNKESTGAHFSKLVIELAKGDSGGRIFEDAAKQTQDVTFFSHVARFFAYKDGNFEKARDLIKEGFKIARNVPMEKKRSVFSTEGHIAWREMTHKATKIPDIECLTEFSKTALDLFRKARDNPPPWTFPNPLIGEVMVWQFCFEWFLKRKNGNVEDAIESILTEPFFSGAINECFYLLDEVDRIVDTVSGLHDRDHTRELAVERRSVLMQVIGRGRSKTKRAGMQSTNVYRLCDQIITKYKKTASKKDLIRLRVLWMLSEVNKQIHLLSIGDKKDLYSWLDKLVNHYRMFIHARQLMESAAELITPPFDIDEALKIVVCWQKYLPNDPFSYLYQSIFYFLKIRKGSIYDYRPRYETAIDACLEKSQGSRGRLQEYFLGKHNGEDSVCNILTRSKLESQYGRYPQKNSDAESKDVLDKAFWDKHCRDFLLECTGRIKYTEGSFRGKTRPYIVMEPGNIKVTVSRAAIGTPHMDYEPDSRVHFVVYFTLRGPIAKGIRPPDSVLKGRKVQSTLNRQGSTYEKSKS